MRNEKRERERGEERRGEEGRGEGEKETLTPELDPPLKHDLIVSNKAS